MPAPMRYPQSHVARVHFPSMVISGMENAAHLVSVVGPVANLPPRPEREREREVKRERGKDREMK